MTIRALALVTAWVLAAAAPAGAGDATAPRAEADTIKIVVPMPPTPPDPSVYKRIVIGGSGVRIENEADAEADSGLNFNFDFDFEETTTDDDVVRVGESVYVAPGEVIAGDVVVFGGNAIIEGTVTGSVVVLGGEIRARSGSEIKGDIVTIGGKIAEDEDVIIRGERIVIGGVAGRIGDTLDVDMHTLRAIFSIATLFVSLILFLITMFFLRGRVERVSEHLSASLLKCFGAGVLSSIALVFGLLIVMIPLIITIVGIPLAVILAVSSLGVYVIACTAFVYTVGRAIATRASVDAGVFLRLLLGLGLLMVPEVIALVVDFAGRGAMPLYVTVKVISAVLWFFGYTVGLGAMVLSRFGSRPPVTPEPPAARVTGDLSPHPAV